MLNVLARLAALASGYSRLRRRFWADFQRLIGISPRGQGPDVSFSIDASFLLLSLTALKVLCLQSLQAGRQIPCGLLNYDNALGE